MDILQALCLVLVEVMCYKCFIEIFFQKKAMGEIKEYIGFLVYIVADFLCVRVLQEYMIWKQIIVLVLFFLYTNFRYHCTKKMSGFMMVLFFAGMNILDYFIMVILSVKGLEIECMDNMQSTLVVLCSRLCLFWIIANLKRIFRKKNSIGVLPESIWIRFLYFPTLTLICVMAMNIQALQSKENNQLFLLIAVVFVVMNFIVFYLLQDTAALGEEQKKKELLCMLAEDKLSYFENVAQNYDNLRKEIHEFRNQLLCIQELLENSHYDKAKEYVSGISGKLNEKMDWIDTNHVLINAVLNTKYREACKKDIVMILKIGDLSELSIPEADIVTILANLLDNAIEASEQCKDKKEIQLKLQIDHKKRCILSVKNTMTGKIQEKNGAFLTSKEDKVHHGIGITNIKELLEKNHGEYVIRQGDGEFLFSIVFSEKE